MSATDVSVVGMMTQNTTQNGQAVAARTVVGRSAGIAVAVILFASFMDLVDATIVVVAAPALAADLGADAAQLQWIVAAYTLALGSALITGGRIGDSYGRRRIFLYSLAGFVAASALCGLASTPVMLILTRVLQGLAAGLMVPQVFGIIRSSFDATGRAKAFGAYGVVLSLASVAGPLLGGLLVDANLFGLGWRTIFWVNVPFGLLALLVGIKVLPESTGTARAKLDVTGAVLTNTAVLLILLPLIQGRDWGWPWWGFALIAAGIGVLFAFVAFEKHVAARGGQPLLDPSLLRVRSFSAGLVAATLFFGAIAAFFLALSVYLQDGTGRSAWQTGLVILPYAFGSIITSGVGIALVAKAGRALCITGALILAISQAMLWWLVRDGQDPGYWMLALALFIGGLGLGLTAPILVNLILAGIPGKDAGAAGGVLTTATQIGGAAGIAVLGTVFFAAADRGDSPDRIQVFSDALGAVLPWQVLLYLAAAALMLLLPRVAAAQPEH